MWHETADTLSSPQYAVSLALMYLFLGNVDVVLCDIE